MPRFWICFWCPFSLMLDKFCSSPHQVAFGGGLVKGWGDLDQRGLVATQGKGGGQLGVGAAPPRQQGARPPSQSFSLLARKVQRPQSWRRVTPAFATTCCSGSPPTCCQAKHTREHVARQNTHEATFSKIQSYGPSTDYQALRLCWWWIIWDC